MKYQNKTSKIVVDAVQFKQDSPIQLIFENGVKHTDIRKNQYLVSFFNSVGQVIEQMIMDEEAFVEQFEPKKDLLFD